MGVVGFVGAFFLAVLTGIVANEYGVWAAPVSKWLIVLRCDDTTARDLEAQCSRTYWIQRVRLGSCFAR